MKGEGVLGSTHTLHHTQHYTKPGLVDNLHVTSKIVDKTTTKTKYSRYCSVFSLKKYCLLIYFSWLIVTSKTFHLAVNLEYQSAYRIYHLLVPFLYSILSRNKNDSFRSLLVFHISSLQEENERQITYKWCCHEQNFDSN